MNFWADIDDLIPIKNGDIAPNNLNSFFSAVFFSWMNPIIWKGYKVPLSQNDLFTLPSKVDVDLNVQLFERNYEQYLRSNGIHFGQSKKEGKKSKKVQLWSPLLQTYGKTLLLANTLAFIHYSITFVGPQILKLLISHIEDPDVHAWKGIFYSLLLLCIYFTSSVFFASYLAQMYSIAVSVSTFELRTYGNTI